MTQYTKFTWIYNDDEDEDVEIHEIDPDGDEDDEDEGEIDPSVITMTRISPPYGPIASIIQVEAEIG